MSCAEPDPEHPLQEDSTWLFTCRHEHEPRLVEELTRLGCEPAALRTLLPGLVQADGLGEATPDGLARMDPVWALQVLPAALAISGASIRKLARAAVDGLAAGLDEFDGAWRLHGLVPGMFKGQPKPAMGRRLTLLIEAVQDELKRRRRRAWRRLAADEREPQALAQLLLLGPEQAWVCLSPCLDLPVGGHWPSLLPAGLAAVANDPAAPSSAFRKLDEALACMGRWPRDGDSAVDLGAAPGGWSHVMLRHGARVQAVDRSPLAEPLMRHPRLHWQRGDAFRFRPSAPVDWLVADVAAYPERVAELLADWCGERLARTMVVQMKFKGETDWQALDAALATARRHGYSARARHFFNDKNEVTLMIAEPRADVAAARGEAEEQT